MQSTLPDGTTIGWVFHVAAAYTDTLGTVNLSAATCISTETVQIGINASLVTDSLGNVGSGTSAVTYTAP